MTNTENQSLIEKKPNTQPATLAEFYKSFYDKTLAEMTKEQRELLEREKSASELLIRGVKVEQPTIRAFVQEVIQKAEEAFDKSQAKNEKKQNQNQIKT
jgi:hypothetical protein